MEFSSHARLCTKCHTYDSQLKLAAYTLTAVIAEAAKSFAKELCTCKRCFKCFWIQKGKWKQVANWLEIASS